MIIIAVLVLAGLLVVRLGLYFGDAERMLNTDILNLREGGQMTIGASLPFEPMMYYDASGKMVGFEVDLIKEIGKELDLNVQIVDVPWNQIFTNLEEKRFDLIMNGITITPDRMEEMIFSDPYLNAGQVVVIMKENNQIKTPQDLEGKKVSVQKDTTCELAARKYVVEENISAYPDVEGVLGALLDNQVDGLIIDYPVAATIVKNNPDLKMIQEQITEEYYGLATWKGNDVLIKKVNDVLKTLKRSGRLDIIEEKWLH